MSKSTDELAADILVAALASAQIRTESGSASLQGDEVASAYKKIRDAVASQPSPGPYSEPV